MRRKDVMNNEKQWKNRGIPRLDRVHLFLPLMMNDPRTMPMQHHSKKTNQPTNKLTGNKKMILANEKTLAAAKTNKQINK